MYISFYITDSRNGLVFQYLPSNDAPSFKNLWTRIQSTCPQLTHSHGQNGTEDGKCDGSDVAGCITADEMGHGLCTHGFVAKDLEVFKYYSMTNNIYFWCLVSRAVEGTQRLNVMRPAVVMEQIDQMLLDYFDKDKITLKKIINNYDQITLIFNCYLDGGEPMTSGMYMNRVKAIIPMKTDLSKVINSTAHSIKNVVNRHQYPQHMGRFDPMSYHGHSNRHLSSSPSVSSSPFIKDVEVVPWRNNSVLDDRNEFYLDIEETMTLVLEKTHHRNNENRIKLVNGKISGILDCRSYLGGDSPLVTIALQNNGYDFRFPSLHDCVEIEQFDSQKDTKLVFIPPNGKFRLMEYNLMLDHDKNWNNQLGIVSIDYMNKLGMREDEFEVTLNIGALRRVSQICDLDIELDFIQRSGKKVVTSMDHGKIRILRSTHGRFNQSPLGSKGHWIFDDTEMSTGTTAILRGCVETPDAEENDNDQEEHNGNGENETAINNLNKREYLLNRVVIKYAHEGATLSGISVDSIQVDTHLSNPSMGSNARNGNIKTAFKGVKYISTVQAAEIRSIPH